MKANELKLSDIRMTFNAKYRGHHALSFMLGNAIPTHASQLRKFTSLDVLCQGDIDLIESIFEASKTGKSGEYKFTKSKTFVRLENFSEFKDALKIALNNGFTF